jgi:hypothetical protein|tara:strand:+ start:234 stop:365 length:132 start_codon:yes stop_codon:yes gene_type:complete
MKHYGWQHSAEAAAEAEGMAKKAIPFGRGSGRGRGMHADKGVS